jgi:hypothetical protein
MNTLAWQPSAAAQQSLNTLGCFGTFAGSPKVVAAIMITQKARATSGTLRRRFSYFIDYRSKAPAPMHSEKVAISIRVPASAR